MKICKFEKILVRNASTHEKLFKPMAKYENVVSFIIETLARFSGSHSNDIVSVNILPIFSGIDITNGEQGSNFLLNYIIRN